jgi:hypothetical protein
MLSKICGRIDMNPMQLADVARAALRGEHLLVRQWAADCLRERVAWPSFEQPGGLVGDELVVAAAVVELLADRAGQARPAWTARVPALSRPLYFVPLPLRRSREASVHGSPEPLRRRGIFAMPNYLEFA